MLRWELQGVQNLMSICTSGSPWHADFLWSSGFYHFYTKRTWSCHLFSGIFNIYAALGWITTKQVQFIFVSYVHDREKGESFIWINVPPDLHEGYLLIMCVNTEESLSNLLWKWHEKKRKITSVLYFSFGRSRNFLCSLFNIKESYVRFVTV